MPTGGGGGGGGLSSVSVTARLTGNGTGGSPLNIAGWPLTYYEGVGLTTAYGPAGANQVFVSGFVLSYAITFSNISVFVNTADAVNNYDFGVYTQAGALIANVGAVHLPSATLQINATLQGAQTINPGLYLIAFTGNSTTGKLFGLHSSLCWFGSGNVAASVGGVLPASIGAQVISQSQNELGFNLQ